MKKNSKKQPYSDLHLIQGDLEISPGMAGGDFVSAQVTDTRLMGVIGLHITRRTQLGNWHQMFYLDTEEYGFDDYASTVLGVESLKQSLFGGLGGTWHDISEKEAVYLIQKYSKLNTVNDLPLPEGLEEYNYLLDVPIQLSDEELTRLWGAMCKKPQSDYEIINYYIMRLVGKDLEAAKYLQIPSEDLTDSVGLVDGDISPLRMDEPGTLFKNQITNEDGSSDTAPGTRIYNSTSLIEDGVGFRTVLSRISLFGPKVKSFEILSDMEISAWEASLITRHTEHVRYYRHNADINTIGDKISRVFPTSTPNQHTEGILYMIFHSANDHVGRATYRLDQDTDGMIYLMYNGEVLVSGYDLNSVSSIEKQFVLMMEALGYGLVLAGRYEFHEPMMGAFVDGEFTSFELFLDYLQSFDETEK